MTRIDRLLARIDADFRDTAAHTGQAHLNRTVREAIRRVPRDRFVPDSSTAGAWENRPLPIGHGQTISQPFIVALMTQLLALRRTDRVLEVGTGSGYQAAVLAELADDISSIETIPDLALQAAQRLKAMGYGRIALRTGDGNLGWPDRAPFDAIIVTAAAPGLPPALLRQLGSPGRMVIPIGPAGGTQSLHLVQRHRDGTTQDTKVLDVAFVPLVGPTLTASNEHPH
jgi:protein-L-isoaspartate(D-aspartate) O-methyltransferase